MAWDDRHKDAVLAAVKQVYAQPSSGKAPPGDLPESLIRATESVRLERLDLWESAIRWAIYSSADGAQSEDVLWDKGRDWLIGFWNPKRSSYAPFIPWLEICNANGYRREKALAALAGPAPNRLLLALLMRRLNDWVPQVRAQARRSLISIAQQTSPDIVADVLLVTLAGWVSWGRMGPEDREAVLEIIRIPAVTQALASRLQTATAGPMTTLLAQLGRCDALDGSLWDLAQHAVQPALRSKAYRCLFERRAVWFTGWERGVDMRNYGRPKMVKRVAERAIAERPGPYMTLLRTAAADRSPVVRWVVAEMLVRDLEPIGQEDALNLAKQLSQDATPKIAERGRFVLKRLGVTDV